MSAEPGLFLSRARVRSNAPVDALRSLLSNQDAARAAAGHRLVWSLFADRPDRRRDFLWREAEPGTFYLLGPRPPKDRHGLFYVDEPKPFNPALSPGDRLRFILRVNATVARKPEGNSAKEGARGERRDIVMDALYAVPREERAEARKAVVPEVAREWMTRQGDTHGFELAESDPWEADWDVGESNPSRRTALDVTAYRTLRLRRSTGIAPIRLGVLDLEGTLVVRDPERFIAALGRGFGRAKAFGCGLMLVRRAF